MDTPDIKGESHGRNANSPGEMTVLGWKDVLWRTFSEVFADRVTIIAAGVTYYMVLAIFPAMIVLVSIYGLVADASTIEAQVDLLVDVVPTGGLQIVRAQLHNLTAPNDSTLGIMILLGFVVALWSANSGMKALFEAMNVAYGEQEKRSFIEINLLSLAFTVGGIIGIVILLVALGALPVIVANTYLEPWVKMSAKFIRWPILFLLAFATIAVIYRYAPSRENAKWRWISWGALASATVWMMTSLGFSYYLENFADYNVTYGTLGALVGLMVWLWVSVTIVLVGAELDAELEHQTARDSTTGPPLPMGKRGAVMADTLGDSVPD